MDRMNALDPDWAWQPFRPSSDRPWNRQMAAHLFRRAGFGASSQQIDEASRQDPVELVQRLVAQNIEDDDFRTTADSLAQTILVPNHLSIVYLLRTGRKVPMPKERCFF